MKRKGKEERGKAQGNNLSPFHLRLFPYSFDLQLFAAEDEGRTEAPSGKKIATARGKGQVAKSAEITTVLTLFAGVLVLTYILPRIVGYQIRHMKYFLENLSTLELSESTLILHLVEIVLHLLAVLWPIMLVEIVVSIGSNVAQVGWLFTWEPLKPQWNKIFPDPKKLIDRMVIGKTMLFNLTKSVLKVGVIGIIAWYTIIDFLPELLATWGMQPYKTVQLIGEVAFELVKKICIFLILIAIGDYFYNRYQHTESLKMKKEEVKDESKQSEGDPLVKQAQRRKMMTMSRRRMMKEIPTADVIITNPTHLSIGIKYDQGSMAAPTVIAKGEGFMALKIRQIATEHGVPIIENKPLAQALYRGVELGSEVPPDLFRAVAEVLAHVYRLRRKAS